MNSSFIGKSVNRFDSFSKVTGQALYPGDIILPDQAYMKVIFAEIPHAIIKKLDTSKAEKAKGIITILTAKDVPNNEYGLIYPDQPVLCGPGSDKPFSDRVRFVGDQIALIIGENEIACENAALLLKIDYEELPVLTDAEEAAQEDAFKLHPEKDSNVFCKYHIRHGNIEEGFKQADVVIEGTYVSPVQEHAYLQPEAGLGYIDEEGRVAVIVAGQWVHEDQQQIAHALNLPEEKVRVIYPAIGGAFGGREDMSVQIDLALAALKLHQMGINRPVKTVWSRRESIIGHHKRHLYKIRTKWGATRNGKITAIEADITADGGAYAYTSTKVMGNATLLVTGPYFVPNVKVDSKAVYTNNLPGGAFRGFGGPQGCFAAEMQMNKLAEALKIDPVEIRLRNTIHDGQIFSTGTPLPAGISIDNVIEDCAIAAGWKKENGRWLYTKPNKNNKNDQIVRGIGFSCGFKNVGFSFGAPESCWAAVKLIGKTEIEKVELRHAGADVGQGAHTAFVQIAADALGVPLEKIELIASDTAQTGNSGSASASRMTFMAGNAILGAVKEAKKKWQTEERPAEGVFVYLPPKTSPFDPETGVCTPNFAYGYVAEAIEVEVNKKSGKVIIKKVNCTDDVGKAINPAQVLGQIEGAIVQASGYALLEKFVQEKGYVKTDSLSTYLIPTIMDIPDETAVKILEIADPLGPSGARGVGEMPYMPFAPAVSAAVHDATGIWFDSFPFTEERILKGLSVLHRKI
jgi:CO/xanthine dehydrogenase Mo-binding subunit